MKRERQIAEMARVAAPVYYQNEWLIQGEIPDEPELALLISGLILELQDGADNVESGRILVQRDETGFKDVYLYLGHVS